MKTPDTRPSWRNSGWGLGRSRDNLRITPSASPRPGNAQHPSVVRLSLDELSRLVSLGRCQTLPQHARRVAARDMGVGAVGLVPHQRRTELWQIIERYARKEMMLDVMVDIVRSEETSLPEIEARYCELGER